MEITLKLFGTYRRFLPADGDGHTCELVVPPGASVGHVLDCFDVPMEGAVILVNGRSAALDRKLEEHDVLAAFPALAGG